jgi:integrase/recombinase XerD
MLTIRGNGKINMKNNALEILGIDLLEQELKSSRYAKDHCDRMMNYAKQFIEWVNKYVKGGFNRLCRKDLLAYQTWLGTCVNIYSGNLISYSTIKHRYSAVKKLFSVMYRAGAIKENPSHSLRFELNGKRTYKRRPMSQNEIMTFLDSILPDDSRGLRNRTFFELIYSSGLRISEAVNLKIGNINFEQREIIVRGKYDRERIVPLSDLACDFLSRHVGEREKFLDEYVFPGRLGNNIPICRTSMSRIFRNLIKQCDMDKPELCTHSIRHSTATHLLDNGAGLRQVQELLGHKSIESTVLYTHVQTEGLARIYQKYHPREHELFEIIDEAYEKRLEVLLKKHEI